MSRPDDHDVVRDPWDRVAVDLDAARLYARRQRLRARGARRVRGRRGHAQWGESFGFGRATK